jgi:hypothetical protein
MSAQLNGAKRTGRAARIREHLKQQQSSKTAREILDAVEPGGCITLMCATLGTLHRGGSVVREGAGQGGVRWRIGTTPARPGKQASRTDALKAAAAKHARPKAVAVPVKPAPAAVKKTLPTVLTPAKATSRSQTTNFSAPLATVVDHESPKRHASRKLAADIDAFLRRGGRIQKLRDGESSQPLQHDHDRHQVQRGKGRATQYRISAKRGV